MASCTRVLQGVLIGALLLAACGCSGPCYIVLPPDPVRPKDILTEAVILRIEARLNLARAYYCKVGVGRRGPLTCRIDLGKMADGCVREAIKDYMQHVGQSREPEYQAAFAFLFGRIAEEQKDYETAIARYRAAMRQFPFLDESGKVTYRIAACLKANNDWPGAEVQYRRIMEEIPESKYAEDSYVNIGNHYFREKQYAYAARIFLQFHRRYPAHKNSMGALFLAAQCYEKEKDYRRAIKLLTFLVDTYSGPNVEELRAECLYWIGEYYYRQGKMMAAYRTWQRLLREYPETKWCKIARGRLTEDAFKQFPEGTDADDAP